MFGMIAWVNSLLPSRRVAVSGFHCRDVRNVEQSEAAHKLAMREVNVHFVDVVLDALEIVVGQHDGHR